VPAVLLRVLALGKSQPSLEPRSHILEKSQPTIDLGRLRIPGQMVFIKKKRALGQSSQPPCPEVNS